MSGNEERPTSRLLSRLLPAALAVAALVVAPSTRASDVTGARLAALAARAGADPGALATLRAIDRVDGRPADLAASLGVSGPELTARLHTLAVVARASTRTVPAAGSRASAHAILSERRFKGSGVPRPLHRPLRWLGRELRRVYEQVSGWLPGGGNAFWTLLAAAVAAGAAIGALRVARRRSARLVDRDTTPVRAGTEDPRRLEREAEEAEREGDLERALRLRFRAGLLRLARVESIPLRASLTNGEIARRLESSSFRLLAADFDEVVYGRRAAGGEDVDRAREEWPKVLEEAGRQ